MLHDAAIITAFNNNNTILDNREFDVLLLLGFTVTDVFVGLTN